MILSTIGDGDVFLFFVEFFLFVIWFWLLITIFGDLFRDHEMSGGMKAFWIFFVIILPFLGILVYLIARGSGMAGRAMKAQQEAQAQMDEYVRQTAGAGTLDRADRPGQGPARRRHHRPGRVRQAQGQGPGLNPAGMS